MCGLVAVKSAHKRSEREWASLLKPMTDAMAHRGPDAEGSLILDDGRTGFGHRRLSIVNLNSDGNQPMSASDQGVSLVFNGEIYNHRALRAELEVSGETFRTANSDTEVILRGFLAWGWQALLNRLHGMFAIVLWDQNTRTLFAARDRLGIKPLYYSKIGHDLVFASEIKAIAQHPKFEVRMNEVACLDVLNVLATPPPHTLFDGVFKLGPGESLAVSADGIGHKTTYWHPAPARDAKMLTSVEEARATVHERLKAAVQCRMANEVETSVMLSGGVDSSLILALAAEMGGIPKAFTAAYVNDPLNESDAAAQVARTFGAEHHILDIEEDKAMSGTLSLMSDMDEPIADWACIPLNYLAKQVHSNDVKVTLVGEGADELFCGYDAWQDFMRDSALFSALSRVGRLGLGGSMAWATRVASRILPLTRMGLIGAGDVLSDVLRGRGRFRSGAESLRPLQVDRLLKPGWNMRATTPDPFAADHSKTEELASRLNRLAGAFPASDLKSEEIFEIMRRRDIGFRLPELLLMRVDKVTMASSLEARVPFLDHELVEWMLGVPTHLTLQDGGTKPLLKQIASGYLSDDVINRPKIGLGAPMTKWLRGEFGLEVRDILHAETSRPDSPFCAKAVDALLQRHRSAARDYASYLWPIVNIALWRQRWLP